MVVGRVLEGAECNGGAGSGWRARPGRGSERTRPSGEERRDLRWYTQNLAMTRDRGAGARVSF